MSAEWSCTVSKETKRYSLHHPKYSINIKLQLPSLKCCNQSVVPVTIGNLNPTSGTYSIIVLDECTARDKPSWNAEVIFPNRTETIRRSLCLHQLWMKISKKVVSYHLQQLMEWFPFPSVLVLFSLASLATRWWTLVPDWVLSPVTSILSHTAVVGLPAGRSCLPVRGYW